MSPLVVQKATDRVILGLMTFGPDESTGARITDQSEFGKILDAFQARGYNEVDTARVYGGGKQEAFTREVGWKDRGLTLATKIVYPSKDGLNAHDEVLKSLDISLKELGTDTVDILYLHAAVSPPEPWEICTPKWSTDRCLGPRHSFCRHAVGHRQAAQGGQVRKIRHQ